MRSCRLAVSPYDTTASRFAGQGFATEECLQDFDNPGAAGRTARGHPVEFASFREQTVGSIDDIATLHPYKLGYTGVDCFGSL